MLDKLALLTTVLEQETQSFQIKVNQFIFNSELVEHASFNRAQVMCVRVILLI